MKCSSLRLNDSSGPEVRFGRSHSLRLECPKFLLAEFAGNFDRAAVGIDNGFADREAKAGAAFGGRA